MSPKKKKKEEVTSISSDRHLLRINKPSQNQYKIIELSSFIESTQAISLDRVKEAVID